MKNEKWFPKFHDFLTNQKHLDEKPKNVPIGLKFIQTSVVLRESMWWAAKLMTYEKKNIHIWFHP